MLEFAGFHARLCRTLLTQMSEFAAPFLPKLLELLKKLRAKRPAYVRRPPPDLELHLTAISAGPPYLLRNPDFSQLTNRNPPGASNFGSPGAGSDLQLQLLDLVLGAIPAGQARSPGPAECARAASRAPSRCPSPARRSGTGADGPQRHGAVDRGDERRVHAGRAVVIESQDHAAESRVMGTSLVCTRSSTTFHRARPGW